MYQNTRPKKIKNNKKDTHPLQFDFIPDAKFDYHGLGKLDPYDIEVHLTAFIEDAYLAGHAKVLIITGKGKVVRPLVNQYLRRLKRVKEFRTAGYYNGQDGAFEVFLKR